MPTILTKPTFLTPLGLKMEHKKSLKCNNSIQALLPIGLSILCLMDNTALHLVYVTFNPDGEIAQWKSVCNIVLLRSGWNGI